MKRILIIFLFISFAASNAMAAKVLKVSKAGDLAKILSQADKDTMTVLKLSGVINRDDFFTMRDSMPALTIIDLSKVRVVGDSIPNFALISTPQSNRKYDRLNRVVLPKRIKKIGRYAFAGNKGLRGTLTIPNSVVECGRGAFSNCVRFDKLIIPKGLTKIGEMQYYCCLGLNGDLDIPKNITEICDAAFAYCSGFEGTLTIPTSVTKIGAGAFNKCSGFSGELIIPSSVTEIGELAFTDCRNFSGNLVIPNSITNIPIGAFGFCIGFDGTLTLPVGLKEIGSFAFTDCLNLKGTITIPQSVTSIEEYAFRNCNSIDALKVSWESPIPYTDQMFPEDKIVYVPQASIQKYKTAEGWSNLILEGY